MFVSDDKPRVVNTANLMNPMTSLSDSKAEEYRNRILKSPNFFPNAKNVYYVSQNGNDSADGRTEGSAIRTLGALAKKKLSYGDAVLFERGGVYRGNISCDVSGIYYGAYGEGDKPCIYLSFMNFAKANWQNEGGNIWSVEVPDPQDIGIIVMNHGEKVGIKKKSMDAVKNDSDFFYNSKRVYFYSVKAPCERWYSIEIGGLTHIFLINPGVNDITIENLTIKYGGAMAILALNDTKKMTVRNCEIGWIGGCFLHNYGDGTVRYGNGIEIWNGCDGVLVEDCWIYQIYDSGLSHQGNGSFIEKNIIFRRNLIEYTSFASIEYWANDANKNSMENICYEDNILRFAGYGWGDIERPDTVAYHILSTGKMDHKCMNFKIINNILDTSKRGLIMCTSRVGTVPEIKGNTYMQFYGGQLGSYGNVDCPTYLFDADVDEKVKNVLGDNCANVSILGSVKLK